MKTYRYSLGRYAAYSPSRWQALKGLITLIYFDLRIKLWKRN
jgi:hypothetical protein